MEILFGLVSGFISSIGMGGGTILIFLLTTILKTDQHIAQGANLIFFIPTCITAIIINWKNKNIRFKIAVPVIISGIIGSIIGAKLSVKLEVKTLKMYFGVFLVLIGAYEIYSLKKEYTKAKKEDNKSIK